MKKLLVILILALCSSFCSNAQQVKLFVEQTQNAAILYAQNNEVAPYSISLQLNLENMIFSEGNRSTFVIPGQTAKFKIGELTPASNSRYKFSYTFKSAMGNLQMKPELNYVYDLPFATGASFRLFQGYNGKFSHSNENALDFTMPEGSLILAARSGLVVQVVDNNSTTCIQEECKKYNNYVTVMHNDGSFASYLHIKQNGALVKIGDSILQGAKLAFSGNVGYSSGPHLHFMCYTNSFSGFNTLVTKFRVNDGNSFTMLVEGNTYSRNY